MTAPLPPYQPGSPAWQAGYEHARRQAAERVGCGCRQAPAVMAAVARGGANSVDRWVACGQDECGAIAAADILAMRPSPPRVSPGMEPTPYSAPTNVAAAGGGPVAQQDVQALYEAQRAKARAATLAAYAAAGAKG